MNGKTTLSKGSIGTDFGHKKGYHALDLKGFFSLLLKCSLKTLRSQYVPQIKKKQPGNRCPLNAPCVGCRIVPGAKGGAGDLAMSIATQWPLGCTILRKLALLTPSDGDAEAPRSRLRSRKTDVQHGPSYHSL